MKIQSDLANRDGQPNFVYLNTGNATFDDRRPFGTGSDETRSVALGDLNGDGHLDIVTANIGEANGVYFGDGMGNFHDAGVKFGRIDGQTYAVALADLDGDGDQDIVVGNVRAQNAAFFNSGGGTSFEEVRFGTPEQITYGVAVADVNNDGYPDIAVANSGSVNVIHMARPPRR